MKRILGWLATLLVAGCICYAGVAFAFQPFAYMVPSSEHTAGGSVVTSPGYLYGLMMITDGTNAVTYDLYDSSHTTAASAAEHTHLIPVWTVTTSASNRAQTLSFDPPLAYNAGMYASAYSAGSFNVIFYYREK